MLIMTNYNLWDYPAEFRCITTNGILNSRDELVMGAGVALQAKQRYPELPEILGRLVKQLGNIPYIIEDLGIISFPTKNHWKYPSLLSLIEKNAKLIVELVDDYEIKSVVMPKIGTGNGGLNWEDVRKVIEPIFDNRFIVLE